MLRDRRLADAILDALLFHAAGAQRHQRPADEDGLQRDHGRPGATTGAPFHGEEPRRQGRGWREHRDGQGYVHEHGVKRNAGHFTILSWLPAHHASGRDEDRETEPATLSDKRPMHLDIEQRADGRGVVELALFAFIALLMLADLVDDAGTGRAGLVHLLFEGGVMLAAGAGVIRLWGVAVTARQQARAAEDAARRWEHEAHDALQGFGAAIARQLAAWQLTAAEQEVALLLMKGLSHKDVAAERATSERTVRQQALAVYRKAGVRSRAELSAFFLRALPAPGTPDDRSRA